MKPIPLILAALFVATPCYAQSNRIKAIVADMTAMMEFTCLKMYPDDKDGRAKCIAEQGAALKKLIALVGSPNSEDRARYSRLWELCNYEHTHRYGVDLVATLACVRKF